MDIVSHALVGNIFKEFARSPSAKDKLIIILFAFLPDIPVMFLMYPLLGHANGRPFWIPYNSDWAGARSAHPIWSMSWEIPHSLLFLLLVITPLVFWFRLPKLAIASYLSHILLDLPTHTGVWGVKPFYPLHCMVNGFTDAWAWPFSYMAISWVVLLAIGWCLHLYRKARA
jgi:hypothetical protein